MRFSAVALMGMIPLAFASPVADMGDELAERGYYKPKPQNCKPTVILNAFAAIKKSVLALDTAIKVINSTDLTILLPLDGLALDTTNVVLAQIELVKKAPLIKEDYVLYTANKAQDLIDTISSTLADLRKIRKYTIPSFTSGLVLIDLRRLRVNADDFIDALQPKVPEIAQFIVRVDRAQLSREFGNSINYFKVNATN